MKTETAIFAGLAFFFVPIAFVYWWLTDWQEHVGYFALVLCGALGGLVAAYLYTTSRRIDSRPEDDPTGEIEDGAGEQGFFSPHSWWPLPLAGFSAVCFLGVAIGWWIFFIGAVGAGVALVGWVFEYYRGAHAH